MARIIRDSDDFSLALPRFAIESGDFLKLLEKLNVSESSFSVETGEFLDEERTFLYSKEDVQRNISMFKSPFKVKVDGLDINLRKHYRKVSFKENHRARAMALVAELSECVPWYSKLFTSLPGVISKNLFLLALLPEVLRQFIWPEVSVNISLSLVTLLTILLLFIPEFWFFNARVYYKPRDNFIQRNKDKIVWGVGSAILALIVSLYGNQAKELVFGLQTETKDQ